MVTEIIKPRIHLVTYEELPDALKKYIENISKLTNIPIEQMIRSEAVEKYLEKFGYKIKSL